MPKRYLLTIILIIPILRVSASEYRYILSWENPQTHLYHISLTTEKTEGESTVYQLPAWRPGRYIIQDYAAAVSDFSAEDQKGNALAWQRIDKHSWKVTNPTQGEITIRYKFYANVMDAGSSVLNSTEAYFNGSNLFMHIKDLYDIPCSIVFPKLSRSWRVATTLQRGNSYNHYLADNYHDFIDAPTILSPTLKTISLTLNEVAYYFHFQGEFQGGKATEDTLLKNVSKIIREQIAIFGEIPLREYHFIYHLLPYNMRHAVEHKHGASFTLPATVCSSPEALRGLYGITSHEFFHLWNVKRIRPATLWPYDYQKEVYTGLHWFTEGVTEYYTQLVLARAGLITQDAYFSGLGATISRLENSYAATKVSPHESSFTSWLAASSYNNPHHQISYYTLGARMGLLLDLEIRKRSEGKESLDKLFRYLYEEYYKKGKGVPEEGIQKAAEAITQSDFSSFFKQYIYGTEPIPYPEFFKPFGLELEKETNENATYSKLGILRKESTSIGLYVNAIRPDSELNKKGVGDGDILLKIAGHDANSPEAEAELETLKNNDKIELEVYSAGEIKTVSLKYKSKLAPCNYSLQQKNKLNATQRALLESWIGSAQK